jgi:shikimate 5-dehydrogenase
VRVVPRGWADLAYGPPRPALQAAREAGAIGVDGLGLLAWQAALSFERWTGIRPDPAATLLRLRAEASRRGDDMS